MGGSGSGGRRPGAGRKKAPAPKALGASVRNAPWPISVTAREQARAYYLKNRDALLAKQRQARVGGPGSGGPRAGAGHPPKKSSPLNELACRRCAKRFVARYSRHYCTPKCRGSASSTYCQKKSRAVKARKYGVTLERIQRDTVLQGGRCAVCLELPKSTLAIDHDHATGLYRGLLCSNCNSGLGFFKDKPSLLQAAICYLRRGILHGR